MRTIGKYHSRSQSHIEIERIGNTLVLRPVQEQTLADLPAILASFSADFMAAGREDHEQAERDWV